MLPRGLRDLRFGMFRSCMLAGILLSLPPAQATMVDEAALRYNKGLISSGSNATLQGLRIATLQVVSVAEGLLQVRPYVGTAHV
jgi:hypothetical protein